MFLLSLEIVRSVRPAGCIKHRPVMTMEQSSFLPLPLVLSKWPFPSPSTSIFIHSRIGPDSGRVICVVYQGLQGHAAPIKIDITGNEVHLWHVSAQSDGSWKERPFRWRVTFPLLQDLRAAKLSFSSISPRPANHKVKEREMVKDAIEKVFETHIKFGFWFLVLGVHVSLGFIAF